MAILEKFADLNFHYRVGAENKVESRSPYYGSNDCARLLLSVLLLILLLKYPKLEKSRTQF
jgi:hypothetical protein